MQARAAEAHSQVRATGMAEKIGVIPGLAMDLTACDKFCDPGDFSVEKMRAAAKKVLVQG